MLPNGDILASPVDILAPSIRSPFPTAGMNEFFGEEPQIKNWPVQLFEIGRASCRERV